MRELEEFSSKYGRSAVQLGCFEDVQYIFTRDGS